MSRLALVQGDFQQYLLEGSSSAVEPHVVGTARVPVATRLAIYGDGYVSRLLEALEANFPVLGELLGEDDFQTLGTAYVRSYPSPFFSIRNASSIPPLRKPAVCNSATCSAKSRGLT